MPPIEPTWPPKQRPDTVEELLNRIIAMLEELLKERVKDHIDKGKVPPSTAEASVARGTRLGSINLGPPGNRMMPSPITVDRVLRSYKTEAEALAAAKQLTKLYGRPVGIVAADHLDHGGGEHFRTSRSFDVVLMSPDVSSEDAGRITFGPQPAIYPGPPHLTKVVDADGVGIAGGAYMGRPFPLDRTTNSTEATSQNSGTDTGDTSESQQ
jgi:hypothetical protein